MGNLINNGFSAFDSGPEDKKPKNCKTNTECGFNRACVFGKCKTKLVARNLRGFGL